MFYLLGGELLNWLIYVKSDEPFLPAGATTADPPPDLVAALKEDAVGRWGVGLGGVIRATAAPFVNDIYDRDPLPGGPVDRRVVLLGDAAHPICPHVGKGTNMVNRQLAAAAAAAAAAGCTASAAGLCCSGVWAPLPPPIISHGQPCPQALHDALALAQSFGAAADAGRIGGELIDAALDEWARRRRSEHRRVALSSRHYGRLRTGVAPQAGVFGEARSWGEVTTEEYRAAVLSSGVESPLQWELMPVGDSWLAVRYGRQPRL